MWNFMFQGNWQRGENTPEAKTVVALERRELSGVSRNLFFLCCLSFFLFIELFLNICVIFGTILMYWFIFMKYLMLLS